jgi:hypothetical protein
VIKSRRLRGTGHVAHAGENKNAYRVFMGKPEVKRPKHSWKENAKIGWRHGLDSSG